MSKTALIAGSSGLVGGELLNMLTTSEDYDKIISLGRRSTAVSVGKINEIIVDFKKLDQVTLPKIDDVFCCLGTTIKKAGSKEKFRQVDLEYVVSIGQLGLQNGAKQLLVVSAVGADETSSIFYNRVKGEMERKVQDLGFQSVYIFRPSMLGGKRTEFRLGEKIGTFLMQLLGWLMIGKLKRYKIVSASKVARHMIQSAQNSVAGNYFLESENINNIN
jgi:uncharacterized protein YbjT (DUF2867 family)